MAALRCEASAFVRREATAVLRATGAAVLCCFCVGKAHGSSSRPLQCAMNGASVPHEIGTGPGVGCEKRVREEVALQPVTVRARKNDVAGVMHAAVRQRIHVIESRSFEVEGRSAVDAAPAAVAHRGALDRALVSSPAKMADARLTDAAGDAGEAGEHGSVMLPVTGGGHFTSLEKSKPRDGRDSHRGASDHFVEAISATKGTRDGRARLLRLRSNRRCRNSLCASGGRE
jgi:hypothetical protein